MAFRVANSKKIVGTRFDFLTDDGLVSGAQVNGPVVEVTLYPDATRLRAAECRRKIISRRFSIQVCHAVIRVPMLTGSIFRLSGWSCSSSRWGRKRRERIPFSASTSTRWKVRTYGTWEWKAKLWRAAQPA